MRSWVRRIICVKTAVCAGAIVVLLASGACSLPADESDVRNHFEARRPAFQRILDMSNEDYSKTTVTRIAPTFTRLENNWGWPRPEAEWGISAARWDEYRKAFEAAGLSKGIDRNGQDVTQVFFPVWGEGLADNSHERGVVFSRTAPTDMAGRDQRIIYKPIADDWYYYDWVTW